MSASNKSLNNLCLMPRVREKGHYPEKLDVLIAIHAVFQYLEVQFPLNAHSPLNE